MGQRSSGEDGRARKEGENTDREGEMDCRKDASGRSSAGVGFWEGRKHKTEKEGVGGSGWTGQDVEEDDLNDEDDDVEEDEVRILDYLSNTIN